MRTSLLCGIPQTISRRKKCGPVCFRVCEIEAVQEMTMADLDKARDRESWLTWAIEFMRRGLWLGPEITVHGPHEPPRNYMWGEAEASIDGAKDSLGPVVFRTTCQAHKYHPAHVRIWTADDRDEHFPVLNASELTPRAKRWLRVARSVLAEMQSETKAEKLLSRSLKRGGTS